VGHRKGDTLKTTMGFLSSARFVGAAMAVCLVSPVASANGEPSAAELASARSLFSEARAAEERGDWLEALTKLDAVAKVKMTPQVRFHLGLCQEHTTHLVEALNNLERAALEASEQNLPMVVEEAKQHALDVRARVPQLFIALPSVNETRVEVDGQVVASVLLGRPVPCDPGPHKIVATAPGQFFSREVSLAESEEVRIEVVFSPARAESDPSAPGSAGIAAVSDAAGTRSRDGWSTLGWVAVGVGGAAVVGAGVTALIRQDAINDIQSICPRHQDCPRSLETTQSKARTFGALSAALGIFGGASVITGVVLLMQPHHDGPTAKLAFSPWVTGTGAGAVGAVSW
jgi:hypothetical protein